VPYASGKWVTERLSNTTASDNEQTSPNLAVNPHRFPFNLSRDYDLYNKEDYKKHEEQMPSQQKHNFQGNTMDKTFLYLENPRDPIYIISRVGLQSEPNINNEDSSGYLLSRNHMDGERITVPITSSEMTDSEYV
jgi:hypothetical protein